MMKATIKTTHNGRRRKSVCGTIVSQLITSSVVSAAYYGEVFVTSVPEHFLDIRTMVV